ncbi:Renin receptor [Armadillidium nasatum]|uniref:Renin receptor n=1 Tax=Armadillidium nasatum TaxID=96803 RepID=A0A5N5T6W6_9CRUS|nr:Renin receptor [Armadillidium nasatum]
MYFLFKYICLLCITFNAYIECGEITVNYAPSSLRFGSAGSLHTSEFDDVITTCMGYTPESLTWRGLTVTSAFKYPVASVVFGLKTEGVSIKIEGISYELKEDVSLSKTFDSVKSLIASRARRPVHFEKINVLDLVNKIEGLALPKAKHLNRHNAVDYLFLQEISTFPLITDFIKKNSSASNNGQDIIFIQVESFAPLVVTYGAASPQTSYNLAAEYGEDFPVIFNIVLILSIILIVAIIAVSVSMAFMDPGRDSIIYRMTNPRMKKDQ